MKPESNLRVTRRTVGHIAARTAELGLDDVPDPRKGKTDWRLATVLKACIVGMAAGCKGLGEVEDLTASLGRGARKALGLWRRLPDTTARNPLCKLDPNRVRKLLHASVRNAQRRKQLNHDFPLRVASLDGKVTSTWLLDDPKAKVKFAQVQGDRAVVRTVTSCLISVPGRPCLDAHPIPPKTNEMGVFVEALDALLRAYPDLLDMVTYDAGACGLDNAGAVVARRLHYLFCLTANQPTLLQEAQRLLARKGPEQCVAESTDLDGPDIVVRRMYVAELSDGWLDWGHLRTVVRIRCEREDKSNGTKSAPEDRYYISSLPYADLSPKHWLELIRRRWSVENQNHNTFDTAFAEDDRPWIMQPHGMVVVMLLRRLTYNLLTLYRAVTLRSERSRTTSWPTLMRTVYKALLQASEEAMAGVRHRVVIAD